MSREMTSPAHYISRCFHRKPCIRFATNCKLDNNGGWVEITEASADVEFVFVPRRYGGFFRTNSDKFCDPRETIDPVRHQDRSKNTLVRWLNEVKDAYKDQGYLYKKPVEICVKDDCNERPYMYAFESTKSSLTDLKRPSVFIVKIGVPGHYTLAVVDSTQKRIRIDYFDSGGTLTRMGGHDPEAHQCQWSSRNKCELRVEGDADKNDYLNAAICIFFMNRLKELAQTITFKATNIKDLQLLESDIHCQTWVLLYVYVRFVLDQDFVKLISSIRDTFDADDTYEEDYKRFLVSRVLLSLIDEFQKFIIAYPPDPYRKTNPIRVAASDDVAAWNRRICNMSLNMKELIDLVNRGQRQTILNDSNLFDPAQAIPRLIENAKTGYQEGTFSRDPQDRAEDESKESPCNAYGKEPEEEGEAK